MFTVSLSSASLPSGRDWPDGTDRSHWSGRGPDGSDRSDRSHGSDWSDRSNRSCRSDRSNCSVNICTTRKLP